MKLGDWHHRFSMFPGRNCDRSSLANKPAHLSLRNATNLSEEVDLCRVATAGVHRHWGDDGHVLSRTAAAELAVGITMPAVLGTTASDRILAPQPFS
jgi:hypothetical protein